MGIIERLVVDDTTKNAQRRASDPRVSAWVSANAGAGKTKVLTDRVVRLLLAGAPPGRILCLTFTKAAAANMAIKVFERLGKWVTLNDEALRADLAELQGEAPDAATMRLARRLFARAVETPGGLKIETIHAFCERLLHLVPFEANVPARFAVLDEAQVEEAIDRAIDNVLADASNGGAAFDRFRDALQTISIDAVGDTLRKAIKAAVTKRTFLRNPDGPQASLARFAVEEGLAPGERATEIERAMLEDGLSQDDWRAIAVMLQASKGKTDQKLADLFRLLPGITDEEERLALYLTAFFTNEGEPRKRLVTKDAGQDLAERLAAEQARLERLEAKRKVARTVERSAALFTLAAEIHARVERHKALVGALDFDDLIGRTLELLSRGDGAWVLYKLDRGIDHVLVDEAQDTNPEQWQILRLLTEDFTSGSGARGRTLRTLFAVGDPKQSIYSFQGAAPHEFEASRRLWKTQSLNAGLGFEDVSLILSFRSGRSVLSAVDATFKVEVNFKGLSFEAGVTGTVHSSARPEAPGHVELWPTEVPADEAEPDAWTLPVDQPDASAPPVVVAKRVAQAIRCWTTQGDEWGRRWRPGDILVLMRRRGPAFEAVIRALRAADVPVAGQDRLNVSEHIAVRDLVAAGRAALLPQDDLTLATALKSPLVGLSEDDLMRLAAGRPDEEALVEALERHAREGDGAAALACATLERWRDLARSRGPFGFYVTLLGPLGGRAALAARLGGEAGDAIDVFLCSAHQAELQPDAPSLATFLARYEPSGGREPSGHTVKRDLDAGRDEVRVMTVHGAKGLEAPIVVVIDGCEVLGKDPPLIPVTLKTGETVPIWSPGKTFDCAAVAASRETLHERAREEHNRLLYVAMTRAKDRLVIAPYRSGGQTPEQAWCEMVRRGLTQDARGLIRATAPYGPLEVDLWREGDPVLLPQSEAAVIAAEAIAEPAWLRVPVEAEPEPLPPIRPSSALAAADRVRRPGEGPFAAGFRLRGTLIHALLERLPGLPFERWADGARAYLGARAPRLSAELREGIVRDTLGVLTHEPLQPLFGPGSRAEAPIAGRIVTAAGEALVSGQIDRLAVLDGEVLLADYKTTARPPGDGDPIPPSHVAQLALYRQLLATIFPGRRVRPFLIWTTGPQVRELGDEELAAALHLIKAA
ncbi:MAG TPA: double-strand break repair helicase AddA [Microvirga sp.]|jgi:ATP-dependent helicase/nuclease subunit A